MGKIFPAEKLFMVFWGAQSIYSSKQQGNSEYTLLLHNTAGPEGSSLDKVNIEP
jgi:hypothetical protein